MQEPAQQALNKIIQKLSSQSKSIRERAIFSLHTKIISNLITIDDLTTCIALPGVLMTWINDNTAVKSEYLMKVLTILHRYTFTQNGLTLLKQYEATQFLQELRKHLISKWTNVQLQTDLITKIIKCLLPLQEENYQKYNAKTKESYSQKQQKNIHSNCNDQDNFNSKNNKSDISASQIKQKEKQKKHSQKIKRKNLLEICTIKFKVSSQPLPKAIDDELYSLLIQLKHGKKQAIFQTLIKIEQIFQFWNQYYFRYCEELVKELAVIIQGKICSDIASRLLFKILHSFIERHNQNFDNPKESEDFIKLSQPCIYQTQLIQVNFQIPITLFQNPFSYEILETMNIKKPLSLNLFQYFLYVRYPFGGNWIINFFKKVVKSKQKLKHCIQENEENLCQLVEYHCRLSASICEQVLSLLSQLFPFQKLQSFKKNVPSLEFYLHNQNLINSFHHLQMYINKNEQEESFDFNVQLHNLKQHLTNLQNGIPSIIQNLKIIKVYLDCMLFLAMAVAVQDYRFYNFYPAIKQMIIKISKHKYVEVRNQFYDNLLIIYNSSQKITYLTKNSLKSEILKLIFTDDQFYYQLFKNSLNQNQTLTCFLEFTKNLQISTKDQNKKYMKQLTPIYFMLTYMEKQSISERAKIIIQRIKNKSKVINILLSLFSANKQQRLKVNLPILQIQQDFVLQIRGQMDKKNKKKNLVYEPQTIQNYLNYILSEKVLQDVKKSALEELKQCSKRSQLTIQIVNKLLNVHQKMQMLIKASLQSSQHITNNFLSYVQIYCVLEKRLRTYFYQNNSKFQSKPLPAEIYLNILIKLCVLQTFHKQVISELLVVIYLHCFTTYTSAYLGQQNLQIHWICNTFPHLQFMKLESSSPNIGQKYQFSTKNKQVKSKQISNEEVILKWLKSYITSLQNSKLVLKLYIQFTQENIGFDQLSKKIDIINQLESFLARHMHHVQCEQLSVLCILLQKIPQKCLINLQQTIIPTIYNQLLKSDVSPHFHMIIIRIGNLIGWKRNKQLNSVIVSIQYQKSYLLKMFRVLPRLAQQELKLVVKSTLDTINLRSYQSIFILYYILVEHLKKIPQIFISFDEYTQMLIINTLLKTVKCSHEKLVNLSTILLHKILISINKSSNNITRSMGVTSNLISVLLQHDKLNCRSFLFAIQAIKASINNMLLSQSNEENFDWNHEIKMIKILISKFADLVSKYSINLPSIIIVSIFDFVNFLLSCQQISLRKAADQIDLIDFSELLFAKLTKKQLIQNKNIQSEESFNLLILQSSKIFQHIYLNLTLDKDLAIYILSSTSLLENTILYILHLNESKLFKKCCQNLLRSNLDNIGRFIHFLSSKVQDQFVFKLNQQFPKNMNLFKTLSEYIQNAGQSYLKMFMFICSIWKKNTEVFNQLFTAETSEEDQDSFTYKIHKIINLALKNGSIKHCKSLLSLSISAKKYLFNQPKFLQHIKHCKSLIDAILVESNANKKLKKPQQSSTLSLSRRSALCNNTENIQQNDKLTELIDTIDLFSAIFHNVKLQGDYLKDKIMQKVSKQSFKAVFGLVQGLYCVCKTYISNSTLNKQFNKMLSNLSRCEVFSNALGCHFAEGSMMLVQTTKNILESPDDNIIKQDLKILQILSTHESVRSYLYKSKLLEQLNSKIIKSQQKNQVSLSLVFEVAGIHLNLSVFNDHTYAKLITTNGKKFLQILINQVISEKSVHLSERILKFVSNLSAFKGNKAILMQIRELHKTILGQIQMPQIEYKDILITLMYNLLYKNSAAIKLYRRPDVIQTLKNVDLPLQQNNQGFSSQNNLKQYYIALLQVLQSDLNPSCFDK